MESIRAGLLNIKVYVRNRSPRLFKRGTYVSELAADADSYGIANEATGFLIIPPEESAIIISAGTGTGAFLDFAV